MESFCKPSAYKNLNSTSTQEKDISFMSNEAKQDTLNYCPETESWIGRVVAGISSLVI